MANSVDSGNYFITDRVDFRAGGSINIIGTDECSLEAYASSLQGDWKVLEDDKCIYLKAMFWEGKEGKKPTLKGFVITSFESHINEHNKLVVIIKAKSRGAFGFNSSSEELKYTLPLPPKIDRLHEPKRTIWAKNGIVELAFYKK